MSVRHAHIFEHKHTWAKRSPVQTPLKGIWTVTLPPAPASVFRHRHSLPPQLCQPARAGSEGSICRASCPAASWKAVDFEVFRQVIAAGELLLADDALVRFHSRVGAAVSGDRKSVV